MGKPTFHNYMLTNFTKTLIHKAFTNNVFPTFG